MIFCAYFEVNSLIFLRVTKILKGVYKEMTYIVRLENTVVSLEVVELMSSRRLYSVSYHDDTIRNHLISCSLYKRE
jgi:hypothetical protein